MRTEKPPGFCNSAKQARPDEAMAKCHTHHQSLPGIHTHTEGYLRKVVLFPPQNYVADVQLLAPRQSTPKRSRSAQLPPHRPASSLAPAPRFIARHDRVSPNDAPGHSARPRGAPSPAAGHPSTRRPRGLPAAPRSPPLRCAASPQRSGRGRHLAATSRRLRSLPRRSPGSSPGCSPLPARGSPRRRLRLSPGPAPQRDPRRPSPRRPPPAPPPPAAISGTHRRPARRRPAASPLPFSSCHLPAPPLSAPGPPARPPPPRRPLPAPP